MKLDFKRIAKTPTQFLRQMAFLATVGIFLAGAELLAQAADSNTGNISTEKNGAVIIFSTPLAKGVAPDLLINGQPGSISFSKNQKAGAGPHLIVIDLGKSYKLSSVILKLSGNAKMLVYVLKSKPDGNSSWADLIAGLQPAGILTPSDLQALLGGTQGEYLVFASEENPGPFSGLYVMGIPWSDLVGYVDHRYDHDHTSGSLGETPHLDSDFNHEPQVPPQSH